MKLILALAVTIFTLASFPSRAEDLSTSNVAVVEFESDSDFAKLDDSIFCSVALVNRGGRIMRRYDGRRSFRTARCEAPMNRCRQDMGFGRRVRGLRCVELRY